MPTLSKSVVRRLSAQTLIPEPVFELDWGAGIEAVGITVRPGLPGLTFSARGGCARSGRFGTEVYWSEGWAYETGGVHSHGIIMQGDAASPEAAAYRGLALLSARGRWSADLRDYVLALAREGNA